MRAGDKLTDFTPGGATAIKNAAPQIKLNKLDDIGNAAGYNQPGRSLLDQYGGTRIDATPPIDPQLAERVGTRVDAAVNGLRTSQGSGVGPLVDAAKVDKILGNLEARGVTIVRGDRAAAILDDIGAGAAYAPMFGKPHLFFNGSVTRGQLIEELLHHEQSLRRKHAPVFNSIVSKRQTIIDEIEAQTYMVNHAVNKGWTQAELEFYQNQARRWLIELVKFNKSLP